MNYPTFISQFTVTRDEILDVFGIKPARWSYWISVWDGWVWNVTGCEHGLGLIDGRFYPAEIVLVAEEVSRLTPIARSAMLRQFEKYRTRTEKIEMDAMLGD